MFAESEEGTVETKFALHAGRQLIGKVFRYLKRVIVTPSLQRRFARLKPGLTYRQWEGLSYYTHRFRLAVACVFIKQSGLPSNCTLTILAVDRDPLSRSYGANFPSSLSLSYNSKRLRLLTQSTSVGSRYDCLSRTRITFHRHQASAEPPCGGHSCIPRDLSITELPQVRHLGRQTSLLTLARCVLIRA